MNVRMNEWLTLIFCCLGVLEQRDIKVVPPAERPTENLPTIGKTLLYPVSSLKPCHSLCLYFLLLEKVSLFYFNA